MQGWCYENRRNFRSVDVQLTDRVFVIGPNAAGKSNLLDVFRFLRDIAKAGGGLQGAITRRGGLSKIRCLAARREPDVEIEIELSHRAKPSYRYAIGMTLQVRGYRQPILRFEKVWIGHRLVLNRPDADDRKDELRLTQTHLEQISANASFREVSRFLESIRYLHLVLNSSDTLSRTKRRGFRKTRTGAISLNWWLRRQTRRASHD